MPKYMFKANYVGKGIEGLRNEGGTGRAEATRKLAESVGGKVESIHFAFGPTDVYVIADMPDHSAAAAVSLMVSGAGLVEVEAVVLMTPEEMDKATKIKPVYRPPGG